MHELWIAFAILTVVAVKSLVCVAAVVLVKGEKSWKR